MRQDGSVQLFQYWNRLRAGRPAPKRTEVEPADIKTLLADTFILEKDSRGEAVFRLAGSRLCGTYGRELKGFSFPSLWSDKDRKLVSRLARAVFQARSVVVLVYEGVSRGDRRTEFELLVLPLDGGVESPRAIGALSPVERPFWLGADPIISARINSVRVIDPDREPVFLKNAPPIDVGHILPGQDGIDDAEKPAGARRIRHLVVLDGGRQP